MKNLKKLLLVLIVAASLVFLVGIVQAQPGPPTNLLASPFGGPIRLTWTAPAGVPAAASYNVYRSSESPAVDPPVAPYTQYTTIATGVTDTTYTDVTTVDGTAYYYFVTAVDATGAESNTASNVSGATSSYVKLNLTLQASTTLIDYESTTVVGASTYTVITYTVNGGYLAKSITYDIIDNMTDTSIFKEPQVISSYTGITTGTITWDGSWFNTVQWTKHNGSYTIEVTATGFDDNAGDTASITINVHVVHINDIVLDYTDWGTDPFAHAGPYKISYQLTKTAYVTVRIYNSNGTDDTTDDTLVKTLIHQTPRDDEGLTRDFRVQEYWDLKDNNGNKVNRGVYRFQIDAYFDHATNFRDNAVSRGWLFAYDFRILDVAASGITPDESLVKIKYTLTDDAYVKVQICKAGTTFSIDADGDPVPNPSTNLVKTFTFYRKAGSHEETWDGMDENGNFMDNGLYKFALSAKDVDNNHAIDAIDNDYMVVSEFNIDRTASQISTDSTAPTIVSTTPSNGETLTTVFAEVSAKLQDESGGSGVDLDGSTIILADPNGANVAGTQTNDGVDTIKLTVAAQSTKGTYTIRVTPKDKAGNTGSQYTVVFTYNPSIEEKLFKDTVYAYPNPVKKGSNTATFTYEITGAAKVTIDIYTLIGELIFHKEINETSSGVKTYQWNLKTDNGEKVATDVYIYKIIADYGSTKKEVIKKIIIIQESK